MKQFILNSWSLVMDNRRNPLRHLDVASQHYIMQVLGWMWSMVFSLSFLSIYQFGIMWVAHLLVIGATAFTVATFRQAEKNQLVPDHAFKYSKSCKTLWMTEREA